MYRVSCEEQGGSAWLPLSHPETKACGVPAGEIFHQGGSCTAREVPVAIRSRTSQLCDYQATTIACWGHHL